MHILLFCKKEQTELLLLQHLSECQAYNCIAENQKKNQRKSQPNVSKPMLLSCQDSILPLYSITKHDIHKYHECLLQYNCIIKHKQAIFPIYLHDVHKYHECLLQIGCYHKPAFDAHKSTWMDTKTDKRYTIFFAKSNSIFSISLSYSFNNKQQKGEAT